MSNVKVDVREPSENYRKAHRSYMLAAGILGAWEIIGVSVEPTGTVAGVLEVLVKLETPEAIVWVFVLVLAYLAIHFEFSWRQQSDAVRAFKPSAREHWATHGLAGLALAVWAAARFLPAVPRFGEVVTDAEHVGLVWVIITFGSTFLLVFWAISLFDHENEFYSESVSKALFYVALIWMMFCIFWKGFLTQWGPPMDRGLLVLAGIGSMPAALVVALAYLKWKNRKAPRSLPQGFNVSNESPLP